MKIKSEFLRKEMAQESRPQFDASDCTSENVKWNENYRRARLRIFLSPDWFRGGKQQYRFPRTFGYGAVRRVDVYARFG